MIIGLRRKTTISSAEKGPETEEGMTPTLLQGDVCPAMTARQAHRPQGELYCIFRLTTHAPFWSRGRDYAADGGGSWRRKTVTSILWTVRCHLLPRAMAFVFPGLQTLALSCVLGESYRDETSGPGVYHSAFYMLRSPK